MIEQVLSFWFERHGPEQWWAKDPAFDEAIRTEFGALHASAALGELYDWRDGARGPPCRDHRARPVLPKSLSRGPAAPSPATAWRWRWRRRRYASRADRAVLLERRKFFYMPYEHSESSRIHEIAVTLFESLDDPESLKYELQHKAIVDRFGRYPHRNKALGRESTAEEFAFLKTPDSSF